MGNESVNKDYPQKTILEIHYCNQQYPLRNSSQNIVFVPGELSGASTNRYVFAPYQFPVATCSVNFRERLRARYVEHICWSVYVRTTWTTFVGVSTCAPRGPHLLRRRVNICSRHCNLASGYDVDHFCAAWLGRIRVLMLPIPDPFVSTIMVRIHSVIYPSLYGKFVGKLLVLCPRYS